MEVSGYLHAPAALPAGKNPGTHFIGGSVGSRDGLNGLEEGQISCRRRDSSPGSSSPLLSRCGLRCPSSCTIAVYIESCKVCANVIDIRATLADVYVDSTAIGGYVFT
jgi:hypothetical protein